MPFYFSGVLYGDTAFPVIATSGLVIKIQLASAQKAIESIGVNGDGVNGFVNDRTSTGAVATVSDLPAIAGVLCSGAIPAGTPGIPQDAPQTFEINADIPVGSASTTLQVKSTGAGQPATIPNPANFRPNANAPTDTAEFPWVEGQNFCSPRSTINASF